MVKTIKKCVKKRVIRALNTHRTAFDYLSDVYRPSRVNELVLFFVRFSGIVNFFSDEFELFIGVFLKRSIET